MPPQILHMRRCAKKWKLGFRTPNREPKSLKTSQTTKTHTINNGCQRTTRIEVFPFPPIGDRAKNRAFLGARVQMEFGYSRSQRYPETRREDFRDAAGGAFLHGRDLDPLGRVCDQAQKLFIGQCKLFPWRRGWLPDSPCCSLETLSGR